MAKDGEHIVVSNSILKLKTGRKRIIENTERPGQQGVPNEATGLTDSLLSYASSDSKWQPLGWMIKRHLWSQQACVPRKQQTNHRVWDDQT